MNEKNRVKKYFQLRKTSETLDVPLKTAICRFPIDDNSSSLKGGYYAKENSEVHNEVWSDGRVQGSGKGLDWTIYRRGFHDRIGAVLLSEGLQTASESAWGELMKPEDYIKRDELGERGDCTVRAVVWVTGKDYATVHDCCKRHGREDGKGFYWHKHIHSIGEELGVKFTHIKRSGSLGKLARLYPKGRIAVEVRRHALAIIDGEIKDRGFKSEGRHVKRAWLVETENSGCDEIPLLNSRE
jgi:hypothetical protein